MWYYNILKQNSMEDLDDNDNKMEFQTCQNIEGQKCVYSAEVSDFIR